MCVGANTETVKRAIRNETPLPGTAGFAGAVDGLVVRDVLGRYPLFSERGDPDTWSLDPRRLDTPVRLPAGHVRDASGTRTLWDLPNPEPRADTRQLVLDLRHAIEDAVTTAETANAAVAFSGGLDSAVLAAQLDCPLYVGGFPDSHDIEKARSAAAVLGRELRVVEFDHGDIERAVPEIVQATGRTNAMDVQITTGLVLVAQQAAADGFDRLVLGQGADELFGGYAKVVQAPTDPRVSADTVRGARREVLETLPDQLERDVLAIRASGCEPVTPLLSDRVVRLALSLPEALIRSSAGERKWALRLAAREWLPDRLAFREKKAVQYGSLVARELDRMARQAGFKRRMDDHVSQYIEMLAQNSDSPIPEIV
ncbi:asparagine synthase-related protein [Halovenus marina]|uniref:asparagine synthase C-terminal domain-containing protein n=1 Tax=Halovenus marina TaxID=3396621 RepID=UPI003F54EF0B